MNAIHTVRLQLDRTSLLVLFTILALLLNACSPGADGTDGADSPAGNGESSSEEGVGGDDGSDGDSVDQAGEEEVDSPPAGMISSGSVEPPPTMVPPADVQQTGTSRNVTPAEAKAAVAFTVYEPAELPDESYRDVVRITEPVEGQDAIGLPAVFFIYTIDSTSNFVLRQSPAGSPTVEGEGETVDIAGQSGTLIDEGGRISLGWESGDTALLLTTSNLEREILLSIAASIQPME